MKQPIRKVLGVVAAVAVTTTLMTGCEDKEIPAPSEPPYTDTVKPSATSTTAPDYVPTETDKKGFVSWNLDGLDTLNVRDSANGKKIASVPAGAEITYDNSSDGWMHITSANGKKLDGYVSSDYIDKVGEEKVATIWQDGANIHKSGVSYSDTIGSTLSLGDVITWTSTYSKSDDMPGNYTRITSVNGKPINGYVMTSFIDFEPISKDQKLTEYVVKSGDTLSGIAEKFNMDIRQLKEINKLVNDNIRAGQKIKVVENLIKNQSKTNQVMPTAKNMAYNVGSPRPGGKNLSAGFNGYKGGHRI